MQFPMTRLLQIFLINVFSKLLSQLLENKYSLPKAYLNCACAIALKIAQILAAQASAQTFKNSCGASAIASEIVAAQVPSSGFTVVCI